MGFFILFYGIYLAMNSYLLGKVWFAFPALGRFRLVIAGFLLVMLIGPVLVNYLERWGWYRLAEDLGFVVFTWLAVMLWFTVLMAAADTWNLLAWGGGYAWPAARSAMIPIWGQLCAVGLLVVAATAAGLYEAQDVRLEEVRVHVRALPGGRDELRVVQLTDLHLGEHVGQYRLDKIAALVQEARPDILVSTGDLLDSPLEHAKPLAASLAALQAPLGKFAVFGNHEFYHGSKVSEAFHKLCGFDLLRQRSVAIGKELLIAGVDDAGPHPFDGPDFSDEDKVLPPASPGISDAPRPVVVLLKHKPLIRQQSLGRFDLQLSGHTHGGQISPFNLITKAIFGRYRGLYDLGQGSKLYVCKGAGTWGPPIRLFAQPEVTVIILTTK
jgi:predicted MPP superfamily phosphohydrolase